MADMNRREFLTGMAIGAAMAATAPLSFGQAKGSALAPLAFRPLPYGSIQAKGWLHRQLRQQAAGLSGHLDEFWPDVGQSQWFGGKAEGWERAPYWLDGFIPLAFVLKDQALMAKAKRCVEKILLGQRPDGWYAPYPAGPGAKPYDVWSILLVNKVLVEYHETTGDPRVLQAVLKNLKALSSLLDAAPLFDWGKFRWFEGLISVFYVYERTGEEWLLNLAAKLRKQGFDYMSFYKGNDIKTPTPRRGKWTFEKHGVNTGMALKAYALASRLTHSKEEMDFAATMIQILDRYHGQASGIFTCDECLAGTNPVQGTELCTVVEALYSLENIMQVTGSAQYGDRLERIAFNALPASFSPDMWSHQYDQQANQVQCTINPEFQWSTNGPESNLFGLEPNFGCCTANMHQGWPKFAARLWMLAPGGGIAAIAYAPSVARFYSNGMPVIVEADTDYPFRDSVKVTVKVDKKIRFPLMLRVPTWTEGAFLRVNREAVETPLTPGTFFTLTREWSGVNVIQLKFPMKGKLTHRYNDALSIERGPLVYSLRISESWKQVNADKPLRQLPHGDFEVRPLTPWNYGLIVDEKKLDASIKFTEKTVGDKPFSPSGAGMEARVKGRRLPQWKLEHGWAADLQPGVQSSREPVKELTLIPYGCAKLRVTEFPRTE